VRIFNEFFTMKGKVLKYFSFRRCGFIVTDGSGDSVFFHRSDYPGHDIPSVGQSVEFSEVETPQGKEAQDIRLIESKSNTKLML